MRKLLETILAYFGNREPSKANKSFCYADDQGGVVCECGNELFKFYGKYVQCLDCGNLIQKRYWSSKAGVTFAEVWLKRPGYLQRWEKSKDETQYVRN